MHRLPKHHSLIRHQLLVNIHQARRYGHPFTHTKAQSMRLSVVMVRVLADDDAADVGERTVL